MLRKLILFALNATEVAIKEAIWLLGAALGGVGAGILWTAEGTYFSLNAQEYTRAVMAYSMDTRSEMTPTDTQPRVSLASSESLHEGGKASSSASLYTFASIFAAGYLLLETVFKLFATVTYIADHSKNRSMWKRMVFGIYMLIGCIAVILFALFVRPFISTEDRRSLGSSGAIILDDIKRDLLGVIEAIYRDHKLKLILPYQICFGFSSSMVNTFIVSQVISTHIGDGYVGFLSALTTMTAVALSYPFTLVANRFYKGKYWIMLLGAAAFLLSGLALLLPMTVLASWSVLVFYFIIYGFGRGVWENTNKAVVAEYFGEQTGENLGRPSGQVDSVTLPHFRASLQSAYASIYFTSGLSAAIGYASYASMSQSQMAALNIIVPISAWITFDMSYRMHEAQMANIRSRNFNNTFVIREQE